MLSRCRDRQCNNGSTERDQKQTRYKQQTHRRGLDQLAIASLCSLKELLVGSSVLFWLPDKLKQKGHQLNLPQRLISMRFRSRRAATRSTLFDPEKVLWWAGIERRIIPLDHTAMHRTVSFTWLRYQFTPSLPYRLYFFYIFNTIPRHPCIFRHNVALSTVSSRRAGPHSRSRCLSGLSWQTLFVG